MHFVSIRFLMMLLMQKSGETYALLTDHRFQRKDIVEGNAVCSQGHPVNQRGR